ncbi:MAG: ribonuclease H-like domain-containing protein, partial [Lachnospiraceae bacterium]|nr:ribonuclease H-like domain-containing protein [Lachnospiraceae bacterium]
HFNGSKFDIPYLEYKAGLHHVEGLFDNVVSIDVYKFCAPLRFLLFPSSMRQKAIESFLEINRDDIYNGGELISVYKDYEDHPNDSDLSLLVTHNREDVLGMHLIMPILNYLDLKDTSLEFESDSINTYTDYNGNECRELILEYNAQLDIPRSFTAKTESMYVRVAADSGKITIRLPIYTCDMKVYFENYRDYCYIPDEDRAILKAIACSLPKEKYRKATKETCYQNVSGMFVKQPSDLFKPVLKTSYKDKKHYFKYPESFNKEAANEFGRSLINVFFTMKRR